MRAELGDRHTTLIWSLCRSFRLGQAVVEDVVQTVWLRLLERGHTIREPGAVPAWLCTTARRECLAAIRRYDEVAAEGRPAVRRPR